MFAVWFAYLYIDLRHTDKLSKTLQNTELSCVEDHEMAMLTMVTLQGVWSDRERERSLRFPGNRSCPTL